MDEFERLEEELKRLYADYIDKFRCLAFLEAEVEDYERTEETRMRERQVRWMGHGGDRLSGCCTDVMDVLFVSKRCRRNAAYVKVWYLRMLTVSVAELTRRDDFCFVIDCK